MSLPVLVLLIAFLIALWWFVRLRRAAGEPDAERPAATPRKQDTRYHAVSIKYAPTACRAAKELAGRRFLATAAPRLPLSACNADDCQCRFVHHDDRRSGKDRRSPFAAAGNITATGELRQEQREGRDRRRDDKGI